VHPQKQLCVVEDALEKKIGIKCPWDSANLPAYLAELLNELNERTPYEFTLLMP
jgi:hypothetical protein